MHSTCLYACVYRPPSDAGGDLAALARDFSPRYEMHGDDLVSIDVGGLDRLLGPPQAIGEELRLAAAARGVRVHIAIAGTRMAAVILAQARPGCTVVARGDEAGALAPLPLALLAKSDVRSLKSGVGDSGLQTSDFRLDTFTRWGLRTLGEVAALPEADLVARFGARGRVWPKIARGEDLRPLVPTLDEERFESSLELEWPIEGLEPLSFVLTRLLEPLSTRLERRDRGAAVLHVLLRLVTRDEHARRLELPAPMRDVRTLRTLALLDLESHPPSAAIDRVAIVIDPTPGRVLQHTLFTRAHPTPEQLSTLLARLNALMGQDRIGAPAVVDSYRPGAFAMTAFKTEHRGGAGGAGGAGGEKHSHEEIQKHSHEENQKHSTRFIPPPESSLIQALRRCRHPVPARVAVADGRPVRVTTDRRGFAGGAVVSSAGPWRSSGNWWSSAPRKSEVRSQKSEHKDPAARAADFRLQTSDFRWNRDEWDVALSDGAVYRIFQDRETESWYIDAIVD